MASSFHILVSFCFFLAARKIGSIAKLYGKGKVASGMLYPRESESREIKSLDGMWNFRADTSSSRTEGIDNMWYNQDLTQFGDVITMPVPSSYNDVTELRWLRDFVGWVWYEREFYVHQRWRSEHRRVVIRFDSVHYLCRLWLNGEEIASHEGGHLPFEADITYYLDYQKSNRLTVAVNNTLGHGTLPPGEGTVVEIGGETVVTQEYSFDFFNYAGIHRSVKLYTTPQNYLSDVTITTDYLFNTGIVNFDVVIATSDDISPREVVMHYEMEDAEGRFVTAVSGTGLFSGELRVLQPNLWWPVGMSSTTKGYMYTLKITTKTNYTTDVTTTDVYRLPVGIRSVRIIDNNRFLINEAPFYFKGFGKHEDADIRGRGFDYPILVKDFNLLNWFGANSFRTSHYPYSEETMYLADREGFVVIDEGTAVGLSKQEYFNTQTLDRHREMMRELVRRDKNHPCVVMWSVANEPQSNTQMAAQYLRNIIELTKELDKQRRPVTFVTMMEHREGEKEDKAVQFCDVITFNRYYGWYTFPGQVNRIAGALEWQLRGWHDRYKKPVLITEYGAEAISGLHRDPSVMFTEEYQTDVMKHYFPVFDRLRWEFLIGEMIWAFADFNTPQSTDRTAANRKGILTRQRTPKASAHALKARYQSISLRRCHRCTGDELLDSLIKYIPPKPAFPGVEHAHRFPALIREERVNTTIDARGLQSYALKYYLP